MLLLVGGAGTATANVQQYSLGGATAGAQKQVTATGFGSGNDGGAIDDAALRGVQASKTGIYALEDADLFNILCIPAAAKLGATQLQSVVAAATIYCDQRRAFMIVDIPQSVQDIAGMQTWMTQNDSLRDKNAAVYFPRVMIPDPLNGGRLRDVAPSGTMAGVYAATDTSRGVWKAPAGIDASLRNVSQLVYNPVDGENGVLNPLGMNCLRNLPVYGNVSWGARTLTGADVQASEWKYIPVRRLALYLEESLYRGTKWIVFEPNDAPLWAQIRLNFGSFMQTLFRQGAFQGSTPQQAYFVKCDSETTTPTDQNNGIVNILVGFAPLEARGIRDHSDPADGWSDCLEEVNYMAQFSVNPQRFDPYKNFKFRVKWDGRYVAGVSKVSMLKRTTEVVKHREGGDPSTRRKSPGRTEYDAITLERGVTHDVAFEQWANKRVELRRGAGLRGFAEEFPQRHHHRVLQRGRTTGDRLQSLSLLGFGVPGATRSRRQRQCGGHSAHQTGKRRLGTRRGGERA